MEPKSYVPTPLELSRKTNFSLIIYGHSSRNSENLAKIGPGDFDKISTEVVVQIAVLSVREGLVVEVVSALMRGNWQDFN